jgi:hypothetical protein
VKFNDHCGIFELWASDAVSLFIHIIYVKCHIINLLIHVNISLTFGETG